MAATKQCCPQKYNKRILVQKASDDAANTTGEVLPTFTDWIRPWASIAPTGGREFTAAMQTVPSLKSILRVPYDSKTSRISARDRISFDGRTLNIDSVFNDQEANREIVIWCIEVEA